jgi:predicted PurR-regulated permease PerM
MADHSTISSKQFSAGPGAGPVVWTLIIGVTCLLLFIFQKMLWLVVPMLLGLILYYLLAAPLLWLIYRGLSRANAAAMVMLGFLGLSVLLILTAAPWIAGKAADWQTIVTRYLDGGLLWGERSLRALEAGSSLLGRAHLADTFGARVVEAANHLTGQLEPMVLGIAAWMPSLLLSPFLAFFFLRDGGSFTRFLSAGVPNAFFERALAMMHEVDRTLRAFFNGLIQLTVLDTLTLGAGLWLLGFPGPWLLGLLCAVLAWVPYVGSILGGVLVVLVAATDFPSDQSMAYWAIALFVLVRLLDDFLYMPLTIGKSLHMHPLITVVMIFAGGAIAGITGLMLVLPLLGVVMVIGEAIGTIISDERLLARNRHGRALRQQAASVDL